MIPIAKFASSYLLLGMGDTFWHNMWHHLDAVSWHMSWRQMYMTVVKIHGFYHCLPVTKRNEMFKFADNADLVIPARNIDSCAIVIQLVQTWATRNNLNLNCKKSYEIIFRKSRSRGSQNVVRELAGVNRVTTLNILDVTLMNNFSMANHMSDVLHPPGSRYTHFGFFDRMAWARRISRRFYAPRSLAGWPMLHWLGEALPTRMSEAEYRLSFGASKPVSARATSIAFKNYARLRTINYLDAWPLLTSILCTDFSRPR